MNAAYLVCLFACPRVSPAGMWQAGKRGGGEAQPRFEADELGGVKGHNDPMIGTTEGEGVAM